MEITRELEELIEVYNEPYSLDWVDRLKPFISAYEYDEFNGQHFIKSCGYVIQIEIKDIMPMEKACFDVFITFYDDGDIPCVIESWVCGRDKEEYKIIAEFKKELEQKRSEFEA